VFRATSAGAADFGVVPVENSTEGVVARSLDLLLHTPLSIIGETSLLVRHNLLRTRAGLDGIQAVLAHPQALAQCHAWLSQNLPQAERRPVASNAEGARLAALDPELAALAGDRAASEFGLHVAAPAIHGQHDVKVVPLPGACRRQAAAVTGGEPQEKGGDEQDDRDDDQQLDQREALPGKGTGGHYWMAKTCAKSDAPSPSKDSKSSPRSVV
jgi:hypothetical protein